MSYCPLGSFKAQVAYHLAHYPCPHTLCVLLESVAKAGLEHDWTVTGKLLRHFSKGSAAYLLHLLPALNRLL